MKKDKLLVCCAFMSLTLSSCVIGPDASSNQDSSSNDSGSDILDVSSSDEVSSSDVTEQESSSLDTSVEDSSSTQMPSEDSSSDIEDDYVVDETFDFSTFGIGQPKVEEKSELPAYTPTTFSTKDYSTTTKKLSEGVDLVVATYKLSSNGSKVSPYCIVVDLNKANVVAGTTNNTTNLGELKKGTPYAHATAYEKANPNVKVIAATNADFFGAQPVNAFVKDGVIVKDSHIDTTTDVPVSAPMLFGVSSAGARIGPMSDLTNYFDNVKAKLSNQGITLAGSDGEHRGAYSVSYDSAPSKTSVSVITKLNATRYFTEGTKVYKFKKIQTADCKEGEIRGCIVERENVTKVKVTDERYGYLILGSQFKDAKMDVGDYFVTSQGVFSKGGMWDHYDTILGARHSLIENGVIPETVAKETQNGAASRVPRTAVGITSDGKVVIVSVEDVHYGKGATGATNPCSGLNLTQLADFMRYFGCYDAANFDGGGSSQLIARDSIDSNFLVRTKSSDTNSTTLTSTRVVINSILVTTK